MILMKLGRLSTQNINRVIYIESNLRVYSLLKRKIMPIYLFILYLFHLIIKKLIEKPHRKIRILKTSIQWHDQGKSPTRKVHVLTPKCWMTRTTH